MISISAGNHAQALAYACAQEGIDCLVVMWRGASPLKLAAARGYGAAVDLESAGPDDAFERLAALMEETGRTLVHPFDDPSCHRRAGDGRARDSRRRTGRRRRRRAGRAAAGSSRASPRPPRGEPVGPRRRGRAGGLRRAAPLARRGASGTPSTGAGRSPTGSSAPSWGSVASRSARAGVDESVTVTRRRDPGRLALSLRAREAGRRAGRRRGSRRRCLPARSTSAGAAAVAVVVSGGNVAAEIASGILAES